MRTALKIAIRDARASAGKFLFVVFAVAAGVGSLTGVRGFSDAFRSMLLKQARALMAADASVRVFGEPTEAQMNAVAKLQTLRVDYTRVTETVSMVSSQPVPDPVLVSLKAVDPAVFPFYGKVTTDPATTKLSAVLNERTALVSEDLRMRLKADIGQSISVGGKPFQVVGVVSSEPDRMSGSFNVGPRLMISRAGLERTGLIGVGSRASERLLFRMRAGAPPISEVTQSLKQTFPEALIVDFRETNPNIARGLDRATTFLSLVSLIGLIVGAIGVATAMHAHLQGKLDTIAVMKSIGARSNQVVRIYVIQTLLLGLAGGLAGTLVGAGVQAVLPIFVERYFQTRPDTVFSFGSALQGLALGVLTSLLFTVPPLLGIRRIRPGLILRRDMPEQKLPWRERLSNAKASIASGALICVALAAIAAWLVSGSWSDAFRIGGYFVGGLLISLFLLVAVSSGLLRLLKMLVRRIPMPVFIRQAISNLYRPGSQAQAVLTALGIGVMFTLTVYLVQKSVLTEITRSAPPGMANVFFLDITATQRDSLLQLIRQQPGVEREPEIISTVSGRISAVNGVPIGQIQLTDGFARRYRMARALNAVEKKPNGTEVLQGRFWSGPASVPEISVTQNVARVLHVGAGSTISWNVFGRNIETRVTSVHRTEAQRLRANLEFLISPGVLDGLPTVYYAAARVKTAAIPALQRASYQQFPTITVLNIADVLDRIGEIVDQIALVVRFISAFAVLAGAIILASSVAGTRFRRIREVVILKTLGATRSRIARMFSIEFLILGIVAGTMGSLLASAFSALVLKRLFDAPFQFSAVPNLIAVLATALVATAAGWLASFRILGQKPLEILRGE